MKINSRPIEIQSEFSLPALWSVRRMAAHGDSKTGNQLEDENTDQNPRGDVHIDRDIDKEVENKLARIKWVIEEKQKLERALRQAQVYEQN